MNNPTIDNDLQKAIDDITKVTEGDPIFADPVAAAPQMPAIPTPAPVAPEPVVPAPVIPPVPTATPVVAAPVVEEETIVSETTLEEPEKTFEPFVTAPEDNLDISQVKEAALRDLAPILGKLDLAPEKKFGIYKNVIENYHDTSVLGSAYRTAGNIQDDKERAEALLYLVESIDKM